MGASAVIETERLAGRPPRIDWALGERALTRLVSLIRPENLRSIRGAERLGERYERDVEVRGLPTRLYSL